MVKKSMIFWTPQNVPGSQHRFFFILESEKSGNQVPNFEKIEKSIKDAPKKTVQNGSSTFANELMRFPNEAKPIWVEIQKHCKNAVIN